MKTEFFNTKQKQTYWKKQKKKFKESNERTKVASSLSWEIKKERENKTHTQTIIKQNLLRFRFFAASNYLLKYDNFLPFLTN